jgi:hypothetical protein
MKFSVNSSIELIVLGLLAALLVVLAIPVVFNDKPIAENKISVTN